MLLNLLQIKMLALQPIGWPKKTSLFMPDGHKAINPSRKAADKNSPNVALQIKMHLLIYMYAVFLPRPY